MTDLGSLPSVPLRVVHEAGPGVICGPCPGGWFTLDPVSGAIEVRDGDAAPMTSWQVTPDGRTFGIRPALTVDPRHRLVVVSEAARTIVVPEHGAPVSTDQPRWGRNGGAAVIDPVERATPLLWSVVASAPAGGLAPQPPAGVVRLIDAARGDILDVVELRDGSPEGYTMHPVPGRGVVLNGSYGQDGSETWFLRADDGRIDVRPRGPGGIVGSVDPARAEVLVLPHDDTVVEILTWWDGERVLAVDGDDLFETDDEGAALDEDEDDEPDGFGYQGVFLDADRLVASTWSDRWLVMGRANGEPQGWLDERDLGIGFAEQVGPGRLLVNGTVLVAVDS
jgi:hypothetical protein